MSQSHKRRFVLTPDQKQGMVRSFAMLGPLLATVAFLGIAAPRLLLANEGSISQSLLSLSEWIGRYWVLISLAIWIALMPIRFGLVNGWPKAPALFRSVIVAGCVLFLVVVATVSGLAAT